MFRLPAKLELGPANVRHQMHGLETIKGTSTELQFYIKVELRYDSFDQGAQGHIPSAAKIKNSR
jgi:hypothetical protein